MVIGIDIDGVLTDLDAWQVNYGTKYIYENNVGKIKDLSQYYTQDMFGWDLKTDDEFWKKYIWEYAENEPVKPFASEVINMLKKENNTICIITAREYSMEDTEDGEKMRNVVKKWLQQNNIPYDKIFFSKENKEKICLENKVDVMIEDSPYNIEGLSKVLPKIICFDSRYNKDVKGDNIIRAYSWYDIYEKLKK